MLSSTRFTNDRKVPFIWLGYRHGFLALSFSRLRRSKKSTCGQVYTNGYWGQTAWVNLRWTSISSWGSRNTPWCFIPQKQRWLSFSLVGFLLAHIRLCLFTFTGDETAFLSGHPSYAKDKLFFKTFFLNYTLDPKNSSGAWDRNWDLRPDQRSRPLLYNLN